jgi:hypothetical protein
MFPLGAMAAQYTPVNVAGGEVDAARLVELAVARTVCPPLPEVATQGAKILDAVVLPIRDVYAAGGSDVDTHGVRKLAVARAWPTPLTFKLVSGAGSYCGKRDGEYRRYNHTFFHNARPFSSVNSSRYRVDFDAGYITLGLSAPASFPAARPPKPLMLIIVQGIRRVKRK